MKLLESTIFRTIFLTAAVLSCAIASPARASGAGQSRIPETASPDFTVGVGPSTFTVSGGEADGTISVTGQNDFSGNVLLSCSFLPDVAEGPKCFIFKNPVSVDDSSSPSTAILEVITQLPDCEPTPISSRIMTLPGGGALGRIGIGFLALVTLTCWAKFGSADSRKKVWRTALICALGLALSGCGAATTNHSVCDTGNFDAGTPAGTYMMTISATSGNLTHTLMATVVVLSSQ